MRESSGAFFGSVAESAECRLEPREPAREEPLGLRARVAFFCGGDRGL